MMLLFLILTGCKVEHPTNSTVSGEVQSAPKPKQQLPSQTETVQGGEDNIKVAEGSIAITLPPLQAAKGVERYCFFQEVPAFTDGMSGLSFTTQNADMVRVLSAQELSADITPHQWKDCGSMKEQIITWPLYEATGVDLTKIGDTLMNGFQWVSLPEKTALSLQRADVWMFEVFPNTSQGNDVTVTMNIETLPKESVETWASVFEMTSESGTTGASKIDCTLDKELTLYSALAHSDIPEGTWNIQCGDQQVFSDQFSPGIPKLVNSDKPVTIPAETTCELTCEWSGDTKSNCILSLVASPLEDALICLNGNIIE